MLLGQCFTLSKKYLVSSKPICLSRYIPNILRYIVLYEFYMRLTIPDNLYFVISKPIISKKLRN